MYCINCGKEIKLNAKFCNNCGEPLSPINAEYINTSNNNSEEDNTNIENLTETKNQQAEEIEHINDVNNNSEEDNTNIENLTEIQNQQQENPNSINDNNGIQNKQKKLSKKVLATVGSALVIVLLGVFFVMNLSNDTKGMLKKIESTMSSFNEYILDNYKSEYDPIMIRVAAQKEEKDHDKTKLLLADVTSLKANLQKDNNNIIDTALKETKGIDTYRAYPDELKTIKGYEDTVTTYKNENKFISAKKALIQWNELLAEINYTNDNYDISVNQIDFTNFPKIKVYLSIEDKYTKEVPKNLNHSFFYVSEKNAKKDGFLKQTIQKVSQLDQKESLNINMVADVSRSMDSGPLDTAKYIMANFIDQVQFNIKDKVELTAFSSGVRTCVAFTDDKELLKNEISNLQTDSSTALYDALFTAVNTTAVQNGAKCVVAFTDGQDNFSNITPDQVIELAKRYNVPIFIIGVGSSTDTLALTNIANSTNGLYQQIDDISDMSNLYDKIYKQNKEMYLIEYETQEKNDMVDERTLKIDVQTRKEGGGTSYSFTPRLVIAAQSNLTGTDEISELIGNYLRNYINAINNHDYSYIESFIVPGGGVEKEVKPYIMKDIQESLLSHEIISKEVIDSNTCIVTTRETYEVQNHDEPLHMRVLEGKYEVKKQSDGKWKISNFAALYKVLSKINY